MEDLIKLNINEVHRRLIDIANEVNELCKSHDIPLYMVAGTMLGAIRHKGFIPWDDDMDFAVPYDKYEELVTILEKELPEPYRCITYEKNKKSNVYFLKVEDRSTVVEDPYKDWPIEEMPGITIDIFPLVSCSKESIKEPLKQIHKYYLLKRRVFIGSTDKRWYKTMAKKILKSIAPFSVYSLNLKMDKYMKMIAPGDMYCIPVSPNYWDKLFPKEWFEPASIYSFENTEFLGVRDYDAYLGSLYKNYMKMPPKEKQIVHCNNIYLR